MAGFTQSGSAGSLIAQINLDSFYKARASAKVRTVFKKWSACMRSRGYQYSDPLAVAGSFTNAVTVTPKQIQVAVTDIRCARKVNVQGVAVAVDAGYQNQMIGQDATRLAQVQAQIQQDARALTKLVQQIGITMS